MESQHLPNIQSATTTSSSTAPLAQPTISIAILGAGISGLALAISLLQDPNPNLTFMLYESAPCYSAIGAGIAFGPNALRAMERLAPEFRSLYEGIRTGNADPRRRNVMWDMLSAGPGLGEGSKEDGQGEIRYEGFEKSSAHRVELLRVMQSLVPLDRVVFNRRVVDISNVDNGVEITFSDNTTITASAAIGCDGAKGNSRSSVLKSRYPAHVKATYAGRYVYRAVIPIDNARDVLGDHVGDGKMFMGKGLYCTVYQMSEGRELNLLAARQSDAGWEGEWTKEVSREEMLADFENGVDWRLIKLLEWAKPLRWSLHHHIDTPTYYNRNICLIGDVAHASTPHQGAGAGQCLEDAVVLSHLLSLVSRPSELEIAFTVFDSICRPRAQQIVDTSYEAGSMYFLSDPVCGENIAEIVANTRERFHWIWEHDLEEDLRRATDGFQKRSNI